MPQFISSLAKLHSRLRPALTKESGQSLMVIMLSMAAILSMMALAIDGGFAYALHARMQTAADAAALSGAGELALGHSKGEALTRATQILAANGGDGDLSTISISGRQIDVVATTRFDTFFADIIGIHQMEISANSAAAWGAIVATDNVLPLAVHQDLWQPGEEVSLRDGDDGDDDGDDGDGDDDDGDGDKKKDDKKKDDKKSAPGNWGWVDWDGGGGGTSQLIKNICKPGTLVQVGDAATGETGNKVPGLRAVKACWLNKVVTVFLYKDVIDGPGSKIQYVVSGFAQFHITKVKTNAGDTYILGEFVDYVELGGMIDPIQTVGDMGVALVVPTARDASADDPSPTSCEDEHGDGCDEEELDVPESEPNPTECFKKNGKPCKKDD